MVGSSAQNLQNLELLMAGWLSVQNPQNLVLLMLAWIDQIHQR